MVSNKTTQIIKLSCYFELAHRDHNTKFIIFIMVYLSTLQSDHTVDDIFALYNIVSP